MFLRYVNNVRKVKMSKIAKGDNSKLFFLVGQWHLAMATFSYIPHQRGGGHIVFGADPVGVGVSVTLSCLHDIS